MILCIHCGKIKVFAEHKDPPQFIKNIFDFFSHIDHYFDLLLHPIMLFFGGLSWVLLWPFVKLLECILWLWYCLTYPFQYIIAYVVVSIGNAKNYLYLKDI